MAPLQFQYVLVTSSWGYNKNILYETSGCWSRDVEMCSFFIFFKKGPGTSFTTTFCARFLKKNVSHVMLYYVAKFLCLIAFTSSDIGNMCIVIVCYYIYAVINFEICLSFLVKPFSYLTENLEQKFKYLKNENNI